MTPKKKAPGADGRRSRGGAAGAAPAKKTPPPRRLGRESRKARKERAGQVYDLLAEEYPSATVALRHESPYQLAVATILSAQTTDERVNMVTPELFARYPAAADLAGAEREDVEELIRSTGFFRNKAKSIVGFARGVVEDHDGEVPRTMEELTKLPGVGRKTANVILGNAFGVDEGVVVDTHVRRLSRRLGFSAHSDPGKIEEDLMDLFPRERWTLLAHLLIWHGRRVCHAPRPRCEACVVSHLCPSSRV